MNRDYIGRESSPIPFEVTQEEAEAFADAIRDDSSALRGPDALAPLTVITRPQMEAAHAFADDHDLGLDWDTVIHGDQDLDWIQPVRVNVAYTAVTRIASIKGRAPLEFMVLETDIRDLEGNIAVRSRSTLVSREVE
jgi:hypothetical protein